MPIDVDALWDFGDPEASEQRFAAALAGASADDAFVLRTQIARTLGLRGDFASARAILADIEPLVAASSPRAQTHYWLELGRTFCSAAHAPGDSTPASKEEAAQCYRLAFEIAREARLDDLAIDALHMMAVVRDDPEEQIRWNREALDFAASSNQPAARKWEGSLRNNLGYALHLAGRYDEALVEFELSAEAKRAAGDLAGVRIARWMIGWTLRAMGRIEEALTTQLQLELECAEAASPDPYVFEELETLYRGLGQEDRARHYAQLHA